MQPAFRDTDKVIQADKTEVKNRSGAQQDIGGQPQLADDVAERPEAHQFVGQRQRHDEQPDQEVADRQRSDEPVLDALQSAIDGNGENHETVADDDRCHDDADSNGAEHNLRG